MIEIELLPGQSKDLFLQIKDAIGGDIKESWSESNLTIRNEFGNIKLRYFPFDWGVNLLHISGRFNKEIIFKIKAEKEYNPLWFMYSYEGFFSHRFGIDNTEEQIEQYHSLIFTNKSGGYNYIHFPKNEKIEVNSIQINRKEFLDKKSSNISTLNKKLFEVFSDKDYENRFIHHGRLNLKWLI